MKRSNQLMVESAVIASVLVMLTLGGSVVTTTIPPSFVALQNPGNVKVIHDMNALAAYYNMTLTQIGTRNFANASFLLVTFPFVNIPASVNGTAQAANSDLATINSSAPKAIAFFAQAQLDINAKQFVNASLLLTQGCSFAQSANRSLVDFQGPQTARFGSESVPTAKYAVGSSIAGDLMQGLLSTCMSLGKSTGSGSHGSSGPPEVLLIGSPQTAIETGGAVRLEGNLTLGSSGVASQGVLFYLDGGYFGSLSTDASGDLSGTLTIPFIYTSSATVTAFVAPNSTAGIGGTSSNPLVFNILFNATAIAIKDPPGVLPTFGFNVEGNLTTVTGTPLPNAPVKVTFLQEILYVHTSADGIFGTRLTVPANASDGVYNVYASFAPQGVFGPSFNFTSVRVVHLPMVLSLDAPSLSFAGFGTTLTGRASANGSGLADVAVVVSSPWGSVATTTNSSGGFQATLAVSPLEFAFSAVVKATGNAAQPYIAPGLVSKSIGLFNILLIILPVAGVGIVAYEADRLGAFEGLRRRSRKQQVAGFEQLVPGPSAALAIAEAPGGPELLQVFRNVLTLAATRFSLQYKPSQTIREIVALVESKESSPGAKAFREIMLTVEDFLYAEGFAASRLDTAKLRLNELEDRWKCK